MTPWRRWRRGAGVPGCRGAGVPGRRGAGVPGCRGAGVPVKKIHGLERVARVVSHGHVGVQPAYKGVGPVPPMRTALTRALLRIAALDGIESNEAFAGKAGAVMAEPNLIPRKAHPTGGATALGHPIGGGELILRSKPVHELHRVHGHCGVGTLWIGGTRVSPQSLRGFRGRHARAARNQSQVRFRDIVHVCAPAAHVQYHSRRCARVGRRATYLPSGSTARHESIWSAQKNPFLNAHLLP